MASLDELFERAHATRVEAASVRQETSRLSHESARATRRLVDRRQDLLDEFARSQHIRDELPTWPAWAPPNVAELRSTLVPLD